jgi:cation diffusion facilitator CzcD-associated flavoprotein CzcO
MRETDVVVIGAGQAGLSSAYYLQHYGLDYVLLDAADGAGGAWRHRWPSLRLGKVNGIYPLPGFPPIDEDADRPASDVVTEYFGAYERQFGLHVQRPVEVTAVTEVSYGFVVATSAGDWSARAIINATGTWTRPFWPFYPGMAGFKGRHMHTADFRNVEELRGQRVIVVGAGSSATGLLLELAEVADVTWITRKPPVLRDMEFSENVGREAVAKVDRRVRAGLPPESVVSVTGLWVPQEMRAKLEALPWRQIFSEVTPDGVRWRDGTELHADVILWATGFRAALDHLAPLGLRAPGGGIVMDGTRVVAEPRLHLVGYGPSASTVGANRAGRQAARELRALLSSSERGSNQLVGS